MEGNRLNTVIYTFNMFILLLYKTYSLKKLKSLTSTFCKVGDNRAVKQQGFAHVTAETWANFWVFGFFTPQSSHILKIQWEIIFFDFFKYWPKRSKIFFRTETWTFSFQICFKNQFSTSGSGQTENMQIRVITRICVFSPSLPPPPFFFDTPKKVFF